ncbi:MAG TPA: ABC transporter permease subunit [Jatrophihabitantaceae bacterium]|jgi:ABC-2 type transport system permease protein
MSRAIELQPIEDEEAARPRWSERLAALAGMGTGWRTIAAKELSDNILNVRFYVLLAIVGLAAIGTVYFSSQGLKDAAQSVGEQARQYTGQAPLFLLLFTVTGNPLPFPFFSLISFVLPLIGIAFGFDAINGERAEGTLPRLLAQPIHRDDVVNGKFAAGLAVIALILASVTAFVAGFGIFRLGIVPSSDEVARIVAWVIVSIVFVAFWLAFAMLCSVAIRRSSTAALVAVGVWLVFSLFFNLIAGLVAGVFAGGSSDSLDSVTQRLQELSPITLYQEATQALLNPAVRTVGVLLPSQQDQLSSAAPSFLSLDQSLLVVWPQAVALIALTVVCFAVAYVLFMRQEVRA